MGIIIIVIIFSEYGSPTIESESESGDSGLMTAFVKPAAIIVPFALPPCYCCLSRISSVSVCLCPSCVVNSLSLFLSLSRLYSFLSAYSNSQKSTKTYQKMMMPFLLHI